ncbi:type IV pilus modification protein PilV [Mangrovimicrobium sediminis]|uniref:Type IV pilus modification protein PilV n=1 Tax=Mangrovimicrobium sediminis TaxID=2562682 RepID=A0A4Z0M413_9GAMM|nr:type IV pilus modification protein PilV [Haliea sp. SAOS-164]TGD74204.1 type IV pilus modification protein PilV [Haliea sp. SAOS-164]
MALLKTSFATKRQRVTPAARQRGLTLIEVLITVFILSIGVLGIATLHITSKTSQYESVQRARAVSMGDSMLERIRNNPAGIAGYNIQMNPIGDGDGDGAGTIAEAPDPNCISVSCTPQQIAAQDLWEFEQELLGEAVTFNDEATAGLTNVNSCIRFTAFGTAARTGQLEIFIQWRGLHEAADGVPSDGDACGGADAGADPYRRQVVVSSFVVDATEL